ncbi:hypothetical protein K469DRAFT_499875, partial [Zopfia rhizophila CBS 207.26]
VDAICIDQSNTGERKSQVSMMGDIYSIAEKVLVWLGNDTCDVTSFLRLLEEDILDALRILGYRNHPQDPDHLHKLGIDLPMRVWYDLWRAYFRFFHRRRWFYRSWVFQEFVLAKELEMRCGSISL